MVCRPLLLCLLAAHDPVVLGALQLLCIPVHLEEVQDKAIASVLRAHSVAYSGEDGVLCHAVRLPYELICHRRHIAYHQGEHGGKLVLDALRAHSQSLDKHQVRQAKR